MDGNKNVLTFYLFRRMSKSVNADDSIALAPRISPAVQPFANPSSQSSTRGPTGNILGSSMFFFSDYGVRY